MITCKGNGECLQQNEYTHEYYKKIIQYVNIIV